MVKKKHKIWGIALLSVAVPVVIALRTDIKVVQYTMQNHKISSEIRIALITDLHSCDYGEKQKDLMDKIYMQSPDIVLLSGDIVDDRLPQGKAKEFLFAVSKKYPTYYVTGNHEFASGEVGAIKDMIADYGITVLEGNSVPVTIKGQTINVCGVDDPVVGKQEFARQIVESANGLSDDIFSVLLSHRPERFETYQQHDFDLVVAGHAHGGQWRIPVVLNGVFSPHQGLLPQYAGGLYDFGEQTMVVSRGLAKEVVVVPRIFNRPELVMISLKPVATKLL